MTTTDPDFQLALFCDFENVALGVRDAKIPKFDMKLVLERLLLKGSIVVKKATVYFKKVMEASGLIMGRDWSLTVHIHDEWQCEVEEHHAPLTAQFAVKVQLENTMGSLWLTRWSCVVRLGLR